MCKGEGATLIAQLVKNPPVMQETWIQFLGQEDPLEKGMATHFSILAWRIPWREESGGLQYMGLQKLVMAEWLTQHNNTKLINHVVEVYLKI